MKLAEAPLRWEALRTAVMVLAATIGAVALVAGNVALIWGMVIVVVIAQELLRRSTG
jgi:hypothetical protein